MKIQNKKIVLFSVITLMGMTILTVTCAYALSFTPFTKEKNQKYQYLIKLMDDHNTSLLVKENWKVGDVMDKVVYATSNYRNRTIQSFYNNITKKQPVEFGSTWVRIKLTETLITNTTSTSIITTFNQGNQLISSFDQYFKLITNEDTDTTIINIKNWDKKTRGRFWILDSDTGWLYWAQPVSPPNPNDQFNVNQTTDHIIDAVELIKSPSGPWRYTIQATLESMDVDLESYQKHKAWNDVSASQDIFALFGEGVFINKTSFPDDIFRQYVRDEFDKNKDSYLEKKELDQIKNINLKDQNINRLSGIEYFYHLEELNVEGNHLSNIDISQNVSLIYLNASYNQLKTIDVSHNASLRFLYLIDTQLTTLDIKNNTNLIVLGLKDNQLEELDISNNILLHQISIINNRLRVLDIRNNVNLDSIVSYPQRPNGKDEVELQIIE